MIVEILLMLLSYSLTQGVHFNVIIHQSRALAEVELEKSKHETIHLWLWWFALKNLLSHVWRSYSFCIIIIIHDFCEWQQSCFDLLDFFSLFLQFRHSIRCNRAARVYSMEALRSYLVWGLFIAWANGISIPSKLVGEVRRWKRSNAGYICSAACSQDQAWSQDWWKEWSLQKSNRKLRSY